MKHLINKFLDSVLEPLVPKSPENKQDFVDLKAGNLLQNPNAFRLGEHSIQQFANRLAIIGMDKFPQLNQYGKFTFFIPVDEAFKSLRVGTIDEEVVKAHIVPDALLFTRLSICSLFFYLFFAVLFVKGVIQCQRCSLTRLEEVWLLGSWPRFIRRMEVNID